MQPTRRALLGGLAALPLLPRPALAATASAGRKLLVVLAHGGWDTTYALDPKPGEPAFDAPTDGDVQSFDGIDVLTSSRRPSVAAFFERAAAISTVIRGVSVESLSHPQCVRRILTGTTTGAVPDVAALAASVRGADRPLPYLVASPAAFPAHLASQAVHTGVTNQLAGLVDPALGEPPHVDRDHRAFDPTAHDERLIEEWLLRRFDREEASRARLGANAARVRELRAAVERANVLPEHDDVFDPVGRVPTSFADQAHQACQALSAGLSWSAAIDSRLDFDTHEGNADQSELHEALFAELLVLLDELEAHPGEQAGHRLIDETAVLVVSEMTRTPRLTPTGGKDHWPYATLLLFGAGLRGGRVFGATDGEGLGRTVDLASGELDPRGAVLAPAHVLGGLLELSGVDPAPFYPGHEVFRAFLA